MRSLSDVLSEVKKHTLIPIKALASLDTSDQPRELGISNIDNRVLGFRERRSCSTLAFYPHHTTI